MRNRPFHIPVQKTREVPDSIERGDLKNKFAGKALFRLKLYNLETGDLSAVDTVDNKWFFTELFDYARSRQDFNLLSALKKVAGSLKFDESVRQSASETAEIIEEKVLKNKPQTPSATMVEYEKAINARAMLSGNRFPQTLEVLKLLREKSSELKRLGLYMIGNFRLSDMIQEVCECLTVPEVQADAFNVLLSFGNTASKEIDRFFLKASGNINTRKTVLRLLSRIKQGDEKSFLLGHLWSNSRQIKEEIVETLLESNYAVNKIETERLRKHILEVFEAVTWIFAAQVTLLNNNNLQLSKVMNKDLNRWLRYLLNLLSLTYNNRIIHDDGKDLRGSKNDNSRFIPEMTALIFGSKTQNLTVESSDPVFFKKKLKKLQRYFPVMVPRYNNLVEDIINCDYNQLSLWTKACTLRSISRIEDINLEESVVALLFSPEPILFEEAARLISRSGKEPGKVIGYDRIPETTRTHLDSILAEGAIMQDLTFEKLRFLSSVFGDIYEDELLFLAGKTTVIRKDTADIYSQPVDTILWSFSEEKTEPEVFVNHEDTKDPGKVVKDIRNMFNFCYILPLDAISEFNFLFPGSSYGIFKYIDIIESNH
jgi:hypothetical protein